MGTTLTGKRVQNTYDSLLKIGDNDNLTGTAKRIGDGLGNDSPIFLSTTKIGIGVTPTYEFQTNSHAKIGGNLIVGGNLTVNGTTTIIDSTVIAIGDNMMEMAKDNVSNTMDIGWYGTINESGEKYVGVFYDASTGVTTPEFHIGLGTVEPSSTASWTTKGKLVIGALDATTGVFSGQVTIPATPSADTDAASKGYVDSAISSGSVEVAKRIEITVKNISGGSLSKGTIVHASPSVSPPSGNVVEVIAADYDDATKMPGIGVLNETIADEAEGAAVMLGAVSGIDTSSFSAGDELYVGNNGAFTNTKPTANNELIQKIAIVLKVHASNGSIKVFGAGRVNDVPNEISRNVNFTDNSKLTFGDSTTPDFQIFHDGGNSIIKDNGTGNLFLMGSSSIILSNINATENYAKFNENGAVQLYHDNSIKFETTSTGISVTNTVSATTFSGQLDGTISSTTTGTTQSQGDNSTKIATTAYVDIGLSGQDTLAEILANGNTTSGTDIAVSANDDITFTSTSKAIFGGSLDLQVYSDGINNYIDSTSNELRIRSNDLRLLNYGTAKYITADSGADVSLYYNNSKKFETTSTGISVTGLGQFSNKILVADGSVSAPSYSFTNDTDTGIYHSGTQLKFALGGSDKITISSGETTIEDRLIVNDHISADDKVIIEGENAYLQIQDVSQETYTSLYSLDAESVLSYTHGAFSLRTGFFDGTVVFSVDSSRDVTFNNNVLPDVDSANDLGSTSLRWANVWADNINGDTPVNGSGTANDVVMWSDSDTLTDAPIAISGNNATFAGNVTANTGSKITSSSADTTFSIETTSGTTIFPVLDFVSSHSSAGARIRVSGTDVISIDKSQNATFAGSIIVNSTGFTKGGHKISNYFATDAADGEILNLGVTGNIGYIQSLNGTTPNTLTLDGSSVAFRTGSFSTALTIDSSQRVGIGVTSLNSMLTIQGNETGGQTVTHLHLNSGNNNSYPFLASLNSNVIASATYGWTFNNSSSTGNLEIGRRNNSTTSDVSLTIARSSGNATFAGDVALYETLQFFDDSSTPTASAFIHRPTANTLALGTNSSERLRIDSSGRVGIGGVTSPSTLLHIEGASVGYLQTIKNTTAGGDYLQMLAETGDAVFQFDSGGTGGEATLNMYRDGTQYVKISADAGVNNYFNNGSNLGIGTDTPRSKLNAVTSSGAIITLENDSTALNSGDSLGKLNFYSNDISSSASGVKASINAEVESGFAATSMTFSTAGYLQSSASERMRIDSSGNVGIGVTPESWTVFNPVLRIGDGGALTGTSANNFRMFANTYYDGSYKRIASGVATQYEQDGYHAWYTAASDTADSTISWSEGMRLTSTGLGIGTTSANSILQLSSTGSTELLLSDTNAGSNVKNYGIYTDSGKLHIRRLTDAYSGYTPTITVDQSNVGIGITPNASYSNLQIKTPSSAYGLDLVGRDAGSNSESQITFWNAAQSSVLAAIYNSTSNLYFYTNGDNRMIINSSGDILFGTTTKGNDFAYFEAASSNRRILNVGSSTTSSIDIINFRNPNGIVGGINTDGFTTSFSSSSDYRLKENVVKLTNALDKVSELKPSRFNFINEEKTVDGFLAHEVENIVPEAISGTKDAVDDKGNPIYQRIDQSKLIPLLVGAVQELKEEIEILRSQINS